MRKLIWLIIVFAPISLAQEAVVWICQGAEGNGFNWQTEEGYRWESTQINLENLALTVAGRNSSYNLDSREVPLICEEFKKSAAEGFVSCVRGDGLPYDFLVLNSVTGQVALSKLGGAITSNTFYREQVITSVFQCEIS